MATSLPHLHLLQFPAISSQEAPFLLFSELSNSRFIQSSWSPSLTHISFPRKSNSVSPVAVRFASRINSSTRSMEEGWNDGEAVVSEGDDDWRDSAEHKNSDSQSLSTEASSVSSQRLSMSQNDYLSLGIREPVYEVVEVKSDGIVSTRKIHRRQLLKSSGLRPRDIRSVDPSFWLTNSMPSLLVRENAILLNLGSLRAIAMQERVFIFGFNCKGGKAFLDSLLPRLNPKNMNGGPSMPFELEVIEAALLSRIQRLEQRLMDVEPRVSMGA